MNERELTNQIIEYLNYSGKYFCWKINSGMIKAESHGKNRMIRMATAGTSDIQGIRKSDGVFICLEVKLPATRKNLTQLQEQYLTKMKGYGAIVGLCTSPEEALDIVEGVHVL